MSTMTVGTPLASAPTLAPAPTRVVAYAMGGGGDVAVACAYLYGLINAGIVQPKQCTAVAAGYNLAHYTNFLTTRAQGGRPLLTDEKAKKWLSLLFRNVTLPDPLFYEVNKEYDTAAVDQTWEVPDVSAQGVYFKYSTGLDELLIRKTLFEWRESPDLYLLYTAAEGAKYLAVDGQPTVGPKFDTELQVAYRGLKLFELHVGTAQTEHVLFDVGGDIIDFAKGGRDSTLLAQFLAYCASLGQAAPPVKVIVYGVGVDGHALPYAVEERLSDCGFKRVSDSAPEVRHFLSTLEAKKSALGRLGLLKTSSGGDNRATQLFLEARAKNAVPFTFTEDAAALKKTIFGRTETNVDEWRAYTQAVAAEHHGMQGMMEMMGQVWVLDLPTPRALATRVSAWMEDKTFSSLVTRSVA
jgi:hypothetical protein